MPHLRIDYSANLITAPNWNALFAELHGVLKQQAAIDTANCKSRAYRAEHFLVGEAEATAAASTHAEAFVHLELQLLEGRSAELLDDIGRALLSCLERGCHVAADTQALQLTVHIGELGRARYFKSSPGSRAGA